MHEIEQVLKNWIEQATTTPGKLADGIEPSRWITENFLEWWKSRVRVSFDDCQLFARWLEGELRKPEIYANNELNWDVYEDAVHLTESLDRIEILLFGEAKRIDQT